MQKSLIFYAYTEGLFGSFLSFLKGALTFGGLWLIFINQKS